MIASVYPWQTHVSLCVPFSNDSIRFIHAPDNYKKNKKHMVYLAQTRHKITHLMTLTRDENEDRVSHWSLVSKRGGIFKILVGRD